jgi:hypothetical protein
VPKLSRSLEPVAPLHGSKQQQQRRVLRHLPFEHAHDSRLDSYRELRLAENAAPALFVCWLQGAPALHEKPKACWPQAARSASWAGLHLRRHGVTYKRLTLSAYDHHACKQKITEITNCCVSQVLPYLTALYR